MDKFVLIFILNILLSQTDGMPQNWEIEESIDEHSQNLELDDNQNQLSNEEQEYVPSENGFDAESTFYA